MQAFFVLRIIGVLLGAFVLLYFSLCWLGYSYDSSLGVYSLDLKCDVFFYKGSSKTSFYGLLLTDSVGM